MINIIKQRLKEQRNSVLIYILSLMGYAVLMISMFPTLQKMDLQALIANYPEEIARFFGDSGMLSYGTIEGFLSMEFLSLFFILIISFYIGSSAGSAIAGQIEKKTMDFNLSQPISRTKMVLSEAVTATFYSALITILISSVILLLCKILDIAISTQGLGAFTLVATLFIWAIYGIGIFFSSFLKSKISVTLLTVGFTMGSYIFLSLTRIIDKLKDLDILSIFYLYNPEKILKTGSVQVYHLEILFGIFLVGLIGSIVIFNAKDIQ